MTNRNILLAVMTCRATLTGLALIQIMDQYDVMLMMDNDVTFSKFDFLFDCVVLKQKSINGKAAVVHYYF